MLVAENLSHVTEVTNLSTPLYQKNFTSVLLPDFRVRNQNNHMKKPKH